LYFTGRPEGRHDDSRRRTRRRSKLQEYADLQVCLGDRQYQLPDVHARLHDAVRCGGRVVEKLEHEGERCVRVEVHSANQYGQTRIAGEALIALR